MNLNDKINILWADDEIDLLKPHIMFLEQKGYKIKTANNGLSAHELVTQESFDLVFLVSFVQVFAIILASWEPEALST